MYREADRAQVQKELQKRWLITALPAGLLAAAAIAVFVLCQIRRQEWGWIAAAAGTILAGGYFIFLHGVYLRPMMLYHVHVGYMLDGRKRETEGVLQAVSDAPAERDGLDCYALIINVGERNDPEDERLLYYDALKGKPALAPGARVRALSNDKMIAEIREI